MTTLTLSLPAGGRHTRRVQMSAPRIPPATVAAIAEVLRTRVPALQGATQPAARRGGCAHCATTDTAACAHVLLRLPVRARPVSDDGRRVRRAVALAPGAEEEINKAVEARSLYASPFPMTSTLDGALALAACLVLSAWC